MPETFASVGELTVAALPGYVPRLLRSVDTEDYAEYRADGGYRTLTSPDALLDAVRRSGLRGRGGAAFPLAVKLRTVHDAHLRGDATVVVANGEEGEPASVKDKWLMRKRPHLVLDGLRLAAAVAGARRAYVYVSDEESARRIDAALTELDGAGIAEVAIELVTVAPGYVAGEETAAIRAIDGGPAKPSDKPPRPFERGVGGAPTAVSNVETLAHLPFVHRYGGAEFRALGTADSPGTFLATVTGAGRTPALYELPHGIPFTDLLALHGVSPEVVSGALMGGYFAGPAGREILGATLDHTSLAALGSGLGCGAIALLTCECPVAVAAAVLSYFDRENAGQCGSCFNGTAAMAAAASALRDGRATTADVDRLRRWSVVLRGRGACGTLDGAANVATSLVTRFEAEVRAHLAGRCATCADGIYLADRPFDAQAVTIP
ncbi:NADH-ubiquinone oxidoreductase-F iron-sulfur binding region domain-containing protein [Nocardia mexicana]|uniref:NADH:ubiquinone oxidoreductase subunit F (NADH-binding) n=1 Tax=Nocardia mexicana TaxID=279262 RepID=A0A370GNB8_9NOCA|nr:NADH-ubiquinone oxidoreductase-F iron-sulfur binding region domain-containing protein [Nocardia mexicana]RDI45071.1 NADH:ubiquinone oxidoreductase subunit F (NADH-binding) [Nocardia mexicana]